MNPAQSRAFAIIVESDRPLISISPEEWSVASSSSLRRYTVKLRGGWLHCTCPKFQFTNWLIPECECKHIAIVQIFHKLSQLPVPTRADPRAEK
jgi:hypothetical protein